MAGTNQRNTRKVEEQNEIVNLWNKVVLALLSKFCNNHGQWQEGASLHQRRLCTQRTSNQEIKEKMPQYGILLPEYIYILIREFCVSLLSSAEELLEKLVLKIVQWHIQKRNLLTPVGLSTVYVTMQQFTVNE
jgi:hypothetical protein